MLNNCCPKFSYNIESSLDYIQPLAKYSFPIYNQLDVNAEQSGIYVFIHELSNKCSVGSAYNLRSRLSLLPFLRFWLSQKRKKGDEGFRWTW